MHPDLICAHCNCLQILQSSADLSKSRCDDAECTCHTLLRSRLLSSLLQSHRPFTGVQGSGPPQSDVESGHKHVHVCIRPYSYYGNYAAKPLYCKCPSVWRRSRPHQYRSQSPVLLLGPLGHSGQASGTGHGDLLRNTWSLYVYDASRRTVGKTKKHRMAWNSIPWLGRLRQLFRDIIPMQKERASAMIAPTVAQPMSGT